MAVREERGGGSVSYPKIEETVSGPYKMTLRVAKYSEGKRPGIDEPDEIQHVSIWRDKDHTDIQDPKRIAELEKELEEAHGRESSGEDEQ